jgi:hypothetical protein
MLVVIPVSSHDASLGDDFCRAVKFFGPYEEHEVMVVSRPMDQEYARAVLNRVAGSFSQSSLCLFGEDGPQGWPQGPNFYWSQTIQYLKSQENALPWLWMELDTTPIEDGWLDELAEEYVKSGLPFLGMVENSPARPRKRGERGEGMVAPYKHLVGVAVYPPDISEHCSLWEDAERVALAFDVLCEQDMIPRSRASLIMQHCFRTEDYKCTNEGMRGVDRQRRPSGLRFDRVIGKGVKLVHGCTDGSLSRLILAKM